MLTLHKAAFHVVNGKPVQELEQNQTRSNQCTDILLERYDPSSVGENFCPFQKHFAIKPHMSLATKGIRSPFTMSSLT